MHGEGDVVKTVSSGNGSVEGEEPRSGHAAEDAAVHRLAYRVKRHSSGARDLVQREDIGGDDLGHRGR